MIQMTQHPIRRYWLIAILIAFMLADAALFIQWSKPVEMDVETEITQAAHAIESASLDGLPRYDPVGNRWTVKGQAAGTLTEHLIDPDPEKFGPDSPGYFFPIVSSQGADLGSLQPAIANLAASGICQIALYGYPAIAGKGQAIASILRVRRYRDTQGHWHPCHDRANAAYASRDKKPPR